MFCHSSLPSIANWRTSSAEDRCRPFIGATFPAVLPLMAIKCGAGCLSVSAGFTGFLAMAGLDKSSELAASNLNDSRKKSVSGEGCLGQTVARKSAAAADAEMNAGESGRLRFYRLGGGKGAFHGP